MRKLFTLFVVFLSFSAIQAYGQDLERVSGRFSNYVDTLKRKTADLADETYSDLRRSGRGSRSEVEEAMLAAQVDGAANVLQLMVRDNRSKSEFRDAVSYMQSLLRNAPSYGSNSYNWRGVTSSFEDVSRELGNGYGNGGGNDDPYDNRPVVGRAYWRGQVDDNIQLIIQGDRIEQRTISGATLGDGTYSFTSPLPKNQNVRAEVIKKKGRGDVKILQQPSRGNGNTLMIEVKDSGGGSKEYQLEIVWR